MLEKNGMVTEDSRSDFDPTQKVAYVDADGPGVADEANKDKLKRPVKLAHYQPTICNCRAKARNNFV